MTEEEKEEIIEKTLEVLKGKLQKTYKRFGDQGRHGKAEIIEVVLYAFNE